MRIRETTIFCSLGLVLTLLAGCARNSYVLTDRSGVMSPQPPPFLSTPAVYLLTNNNGFMANVRVEEQRGTSTGKLYARGAKFFYAPEEKKRPARYGPSGGFSFLWDAARNEGVVLSEALQGYAPISHSGAGTITNVMIERASAGGDAVNVSLIAHLLNGKQAKFEARPAAGRSAPPERLVGGTAPFNATFDKVRPEAPPAEMFRVPEGFTAYSSAESMVDEMAIRYRNLRRKDY
jgi:hypothetical protein